MLCRLAVCLEWPRKELLHRMASLELHQVLRRRKGWLALRHRKAKRLRCCCNR